MSVAVLLPDDQLAVEVARQIAHAIKFHFRDAEVRYFADRPAIDQHASYDCWPNVEPVEILSSISPQHYVFCRAMLKGKRLARPIPVATGAAHWTMQFDGRLFPHKRSLNHSAVKQFTAGAHLDRHVFNKLSSRFLDSGYYFPYGYLFRRLGLGPINAFGHRIVADVAALRHRPKHHKVVACFGGSAGWSMRCLFDQMYTEVMQRRLSQLASAAGSPLLFTVLNFGQHANVVMDEMFTYLLFCRQLRPDMVIAHDGANDFCFGQMSDRFLVEQHHITYQVTHEGWAQILHESLDIALTQPIWPYISLAHPVQILRAYIDRKQQFAEIVEAAGGEFVWGLQPCFWSKMRRHPVERAAMQNMSSEYRYIFERYRILYDMFVEKFTPSDQPFVNFHGIFAQYGEDRLLLGDHIHPWPDGDEVIGETYANLVFSCFSGDHNGAGNAN